MRRSFIIIVLSVLLVGSALSMHLLGAVTEQPSDLLMDDRDALGRFNTLGQRWKIVENGGYGGSYHLHTRTQWRNQWTEASWSFGDVPTGVYEVFVTWPATVERQAPRLELRVADAKDELLVHAFSQDAFPNGPEENGVPWQSFGTVAVGYGQRVTVAIRARNRETFTADAVLLRPVTSSFQGSSESAMSSMYFVSSTSSLSSSSRSSLLRLIPWPWRVQRPPSMTDRH